MSSSDVPAIETFAGREALYDACAGTLIDALTAAVASDGATTFAAPGGTTPAPVFERMSRHAAPWEAITVTLVDERWTPPTAADSNEGLLRRTLLKDKAASAPFVPLWSDAQTPAEAAGLAEQAVRRLPPLGAVLLGMGQDGHFASLFPGSSALAEGLDMASPRLCIAAPPGDPAPDIWRLSLTLAALASAPLILVLITGTAKRELLETRGGPRLPIDALLDHVGGKTRVMWAA